MTERRLSVSRKSVATPKSPNFCAAIAPRKRVRGMPARIKVAALIAFVLCFSLWPSGKFFAQEKEGTVALHITSPDFSDGEVIPKRFTCDAQDVSPKLEWKGPPEIPRASRSSWMIP